MKLLIFKFNEKPLDHSASVLGTENAVVVRVDFFVGCALTVPDELSTEEYLAVMRGLVGTIVEIKDDCNSDYGCLLPNENDIL